MIRRKSKTPKAPVTDERPMGFDDYDLRLGDMMRGERATMGKSLLDIQRELRIKASYIAAIENCDPGAFETPGFIAGYVRSYARYLDLDPDATFAQFCAESGFTNANAMEATPARSASKASVSAAPKDPFVNPSLPFAAKPDTVLSRMEPGAIGSMTVLIALIGALGYGGWSVLQEVQRVQLAPVEQTPVVLSELDPLQGATPAANGSAPASAQTSAPGQIDDVVAQATPAAPGGSGVFAPPSPDGLDRLYRPQALDVPVLIARDAPISTLDPSQYSAFGQTAPVIAEDAEAARDAVEVAAANAAGLPGSGVQVIAVRPAWVRVRDGAGEVLFTGVMNAGDTFPVPAGAEAPSIEVGESGAVYYAVNDQVVGPTGPRGTVTSDLPLQADSLIASLPQADIQADTALIETLAGLGAPQAAPTLPQPQVLESDDKSVTIVAARTAWVRVRSAEGTVLYESVMEAGDFFTVPPTEGAPTIRTGDAGAIYFAAGGQTFGPYGGNGAVADNLALSPESLAQTLKVADIPVDSPVARTVAELSVAQ